MNWPSRRTRFKDQIDILRLKEKVFNMHPKDDQLYPKETEVLCKKGFNAVKKAVIKDYTFLMDGKNFLHYEAEIVGRKGRYCLLHDEIEVISLPDKL